MNRRPGETDREDDVRNKSDVDEEDRISSDRSEEDQTRGHGPLKGTDTLATTDAECIERERGKRTTM
jgi:hypothetical protein